MSRKKRRGSGVRKLTIGRVEVWYTRKYGLTTLSLFVDGDLVNNVSSPFEPSEALRQLREWEQEHPRA